MFFGFATANFGPLSKGQPHSPDFNLDLKVAEHRVKIKLGAFPFDLYVLFHLATPPPPIEKSTLLNIINLYK